MDTIQTHFQNWDKIIISDQEGAVEFKFDVRIEIKL